MCAQKVISLWVVVNDALSVSLSHHMTVPFKQYVLYFAYVIRTYIHRVDSMLFTYLLRVAMLTLSNTFCLCCTYIHGVDFKGVCQCFTMRVFVSYKSVLCGYVIVVFVIVYVYRV